MASNRDNRQKQSVSQKVFGQLYVPYISDMVWKEYGGSYTSYEQDKNAWRRDVAYNAETEQAILFSTKRFIDTELKYYSQLKSVRNNPQFLMALINDIVDYLSAYTMRNTRFEKRKHAKEWLKKQLWDGFVFIQDLLREQENKRRARAMRNTQYMQHAMAGKTI